MIHTRMQFFLSCLFSIFLKNVPLSYIWGTCGSFLSLYQGSAPLTIFYSPLIGTFYVLTMHCIIAQSIAPLIILKGLPSLYAGWYIFSHSSHNKIFKFFVVITIPLACIVAFFMHSSIHGAAYCNAVPWIICLLAYKTTNFFLKSFSSLVSASALGTVIHMYFFHALSAEEYCALLPQSLIERFLLAATLYIMHNFITTFAKHCLLQSKKYSAFCK